MAHKMLNAQTLQDFFASLGKTTSEVAATLEDQGIRGTHMPDACPLSNAASSFFGVCIHVSGSLAWADNMEGIYLHDGCKHFVWTYDAGRYPELCSDVNCPTCRRRQ